MAPARGGNPRGRVYAISRALHGMGEEAAGGHVRPGRQQRARAVRSTTSRARATRSLLSGSNDNGYEPLVEAIARRYGVRAEQVATANGAAGANFQAVRRGARAGRRRADGAARVRSAARRGAAARRQRRAVRAALRGRLRARSRRDRSRADAAHPPHHHHARRTTRRARWPIAPRSKRSGRSR